MKKRHSFILRDPFAKQEAQKYAHPIASREYILEVIQHSNTPQTYEKLLRQFNIKKKSEKAALKKRLRAMVQDGQLSKTGECYKIGPQMEMLTGIVVSQKNGMGLVYPNDGTSPILISAQDMFILFSGDKISVRIISMDKEHRRSGKLIEVLEESQQPIVGKFFIESNIGFLQPEKAQSLRNIIIPLDDSLPIQPGQIISAKIVTRPTLHSNAIGRITEILGDNSTAGIETEIAIRSHGLPYLWTEKINEEIHALSNEISTEEKKNRQDLTHLPFITIDGENAKDFDDAIYVESQTKNDFRLIVAISDVSHYVKENTALDEEAKKRGTSVYFPSRVIPMLPPKLSQELCSLKPHVERLCIACDMRIDAEGKIIEFKFYLAWIRSHARLTYTIVDRLLKGEKISTYQTLLPHLQTAHTLYQILLNERNVRGAINFELPETKIEFGPQQKIHGIQPIERTDAHRLIEEFMLRANICAAEFLLTHHLPGLYRVHDGPKRILLENLKIFLHEMGVNLSGGDLPTPRDYAKLLNKLDGRPDRYLIQTILLRSLSQAIYSPDHGNGHFGLAYDAYTHFTSPIRRYPDLWVHRVIRAKIEEGFSTSVRPLSSQLRELGQHCSMAERRADAAVYSVLAALKCEYMTNKLGETFEGIITNVSGFGLFIELCDLYVDGLVHISHLNDDYYRLDAIRHRLIGERTRKIYRLGDRLRIIVARVDRENKHIDFELVK